MLTGIGYAVGDRAYDLPRVMWTFALFSNRFSRSNSEYGIFPQTDWANHLTGRFPYSVEVQYPEYWFVVGDALRPRREEQASWPFEIVPTINFRSEGDLQPTLPPIMATFDENIIALAIQPIGISQSVFAHTESLYGKYATPGVEWEEDELDAYLRETGKAWEQELDELVDDNDAHTDNSDV